MRYCNYTILYHTILYTILYYILYYIYCNIYCVCNSLYLQVHSWREGQASSLCLLALWPWTKKLHWNEVCPVGGEDGIDFHGAEVQDCTCTRNWGKRADKWWVVGTPEYLRVTINGRWGLNCHAYAAANWYLLSAIITQGANVLRNTFLLMMYIELRLCFKKNTYIIIVATLNVPRCVRCMFIGNIHTFVYLSCTERISEQTVIRSLWY